MAAKKLNTVMAFKNRTPIYLDLDLAVLDEVPWDFMNNYWRFGRYSQDYSFKANNSLAAFLNFIKVLRTAPTPEHPNGQVYSEGAMRNEFLLKPGPRGISTSYIRAIYVDPFLKEEIIERLRAEGIEERFIALIRTDAAVAEARKAAKNEH